MGPRECPKAASEPPKEERKKERANSHDQQWYAAENERILVQRAELAELAVKEAECKTVELQQQVCAMGATAAQSTDRIVELETMLCQMGATAAQNTDRIQELEQQLSRAGRTTPNFP